MLTVFTLAEARFGAAKRSAGGVGGDTRQRDRRGIAINGNILYGNQGIGAEWGHGPITRTQLRGIELPRLACGCGQQGCLDTLGGAKGMQRLHQLLSGQALSSVEIVKQGMAGEETAAFTP